DGMQSDGLRDHAAPSCFERAHDVALGLGGRRGSEQKRILETDAGERRREIGCHWLLLDERKLITITPRGSAGVPARWCGGVPPPPSDARETRANQRARRPRAGAVRF